MASQPELKPRPAVHAATETPGAVPLEIHLRNHTLRADVAGEDGSGDTAPGPHDYFDTALAACKALTATWYARRNQFPLERVESHVERDDSEERNGRYVLHVRLAFHGPLTADQRARLYAAVSKCPIHKLMTTTEVVVETAPLEEAP